MPALLLTIKDETAAGKIVNEIAVSLASEMVTVEDIVKARVRAEVEAYNKKSDGLFFGLIQPTDAEKSLNGYKLKSRQKVDAEKQVYTAVEAFSRNGYFILIDNIQARSLDQMVVINEKTEISFIKLTPLVGG